MSIKSQQRVEQLIRQLADGKFHSGESIANALGVSRTAVWKLIQKISQWQLEIYKVRGKGYRIPGGLKLLDQAWLTQQLKRSNSRFQYIDVMTSIPSTADFLASQWKQQPGKARVCVAEHQTAGRGRKGRVWVSPFAANLYFSIGVELPLGLSALGGMSLAIGMSIANTLNQFSRDKIKLKWPNDLLVDDKKLAGILVEASGDSNDSSFLNIGVGMNWNMQAQQGEQIDQPWANLKALCEPSVDRNQILLALLQNIEIALDEYQRKGFAGFANDWNHLSAMYLRPVTIHLPNTQIEGIEVGVEENGALKLETSQGIKTFYSGEVSLRHRNA